MKEASKGLRGVLPEIGHNGCHGERVGGRAPPGCWRQDQTPAIWKVGAPGGIGGDEV